ncbi:hypothetical protein KIW84_033104 [Lathyrus oleraceus]|uniref:Integrase zinc-binding domain-containing protein n=1 Tax=Pisum sativum TaxID=3888 RepID=A0A9D4XZA8_PEA|nr:hypothetical protein KIW84_033104 [Pisum sativum]
MIIVKYWNEVPNLSVMRLDRPTHVFVVEEIKYEKPWYYDIKCFLQSQIYPSGASLKDEKTLRRLAGNFYLNGDILYKRNLDMVLLRCVDRHKADLLMTEVHEGYFGTHSNGHAMANKMLRAGYYWLTMESDCCKFVKKCHKCQIYVDKIDVPLTLLNFISSPWPFSMWGIDMIGMIEPKASNGHHFILVAIDYFTKWVEATSYENVTKQVVVRPKMNEAVEATNKNIKKIIHKMVVIYKDWHEMLPFALHGYRTSVRTSTGATPFSLVYGMEVVLPVEVEIPSLCVLMEAKLTEAEWCQTRMKKAFDKKVRPRVFREGDLVLKKILTFKWTPNYEGHMLLREPFSGGALILTTMDGEEFTCPVNADAVKKYFT